MISNYLDYIPKIGEKTWIVLRRTPNVGLENRIGDQTIA